MPNNYYERLSEMNPGELADGLAIEQEFDAIGRGFSKLPEPHRDGQGFEGPTRVGDPVEVTDAVNLGTLEKLNLPIYRKKITTENWNTITDAGIYDVAGASGANKPQGHPYGVLNIYKFNGVITQIYYPDQGNYGVLLKRTCTDISTNQWSAWSGALAKDNIIGLVANSLDSAVIEVGSNANGEYVKLAGGGLFCAFRGNKQMPATTQYGAWHISQSNWVYPHPFIVTPTTPAPSVMASNGAQLGQCFFQTETQTNFRMIDAFSSGPVSAYVNLFAFGRWM